MEKNELSYEEAFEQLEEIVEDLEKDKNNLDESVELFKKGIELYKHCNKLISEAEGEVKVLLDGAGDELKEVYFYGEDE